MSSAIDCEEIGTNCQYIVDSGTDINLGSLMTKDPYKPHHELVWDWNTGKEMPPDDIDVGSSIFIDAWIRLYSVMPSVMADQLYVPFQAHIMSGYGHDISLPYYDSEGYPEESDGDCRTEYSIISEEAAFRLMDEPAVELTLLDFVADTEIIASYTVDIEVEVDHSKWETECCGELDGECIRYCHYCRLGNTEIISDSIIVEDSLQVYLYYEPENPEIAIIDSYQETVVVDYQNQANFVINLSRISLTKGQRKQENFMKSGSSQIMMNS